MRHCVCVCVRERERECACRHVIVSTAQQCSIYNIGNLNTPHIIDLKDAVSIVVQSEKHFILVDTQGVQVRPV